MAHVQRLSPRLSILVSSPLAPLGWGFIFFAVAQRSTLGTTHCFFSMGKWGVFQFNQLESLAMKATLTVINHQAALFVTLKNKRQIPAIFKSLAQARSGLWPKHIEGNLIAITSSRGEGELLKLLGSLSSKGYKIEISDKYDDLRAEREARIAAIEERKAKDSIPPMAFAKTRFSFRHHPRGLRATFTSLSAFKAWAEGHQVEVISAGKHYAYLPKGELEKLNKNGIFLKPLKLPTCPAPLAPLPQLQPEPQLQPQPEPQPPTRPAKNATKAEWGTYALFLGIDEETLVGLKRDQIIEECDLMEAAASI